MVMLLGRVHKRGGGNLHPNNSIKRVYTLSLSVQNRESSAVLRFKGSSQYRVTNIGSCEVTSDCLKFPVETLWSFDEGRPTFRDVQFALSLEGRNLIRSG